MESQFLQHLTGGPKAKRVSHGASPTVFEILLDDGLMILS